ncbi:TolC family protein [Jiulongibacter sp. NS-SX5]|uniref:TolC family protein n=1 Tax=Jiulongibacter sp. NS-SX5 TaxID=3463854 RepID=UPI0040596108
MKKLFAGSLMILISMATYSQQSFTLEEAVEYGLKNHADVQNAIVGRQDTELDIKEIKATGLPKINGQFQYTYNAIVPTQLIDAQNFDPTAPEGAVTEFKFGVPWGGQAGISLNQLIYDATWLVGLRAQDTYRKLADQEIVQSKTTVAENITKAYYSVLVAQERAKIIELNIARLDTMESNTTKMFEQGFVEKLDLDRLSVQKNNLKTELTKVRNLTELSKQLLKFQMGYNVSQQIFLSDNLIEQEEKALASIVNEEVDPESRIEFQMLKTNRELLEMNEERYRKSALPNLFFSGNIGAGHSNTRFNPFERWFGSSSLSLGVNIPLYDSGLRKIQQERQRLGMIQIDNSAEMLRNSFRLQNDQATINMKNGLETLDVQKRNLELANEVVRVSKIKYQEGVGTNLEVVNAENDLRQAQTNYFAALYDVLVAKVDLDKAHGKLINE